MQRPAVTADLEEKLDAIQAAILHHIVSTKRNVCVIGPAGSGKTFLMRHLRKALLQEYKAEQIAFVAPTGAAAVNINGATLHHVVGCGVPRTMSDFGRIYSNTNAARWRALDVLIIDEISMVSGSFLDAIDQAVSAVRGKKRCAEQPAECLGIQAGEQVFGGVQVVVGGDFSQLGPIVEQLAASSWQGTDALACGNKKRKFQHVGHAFQSKCWRAANFDFFELLHVFRQEDAAFVKVLREFRLGHVSDEGEALMRQCKVPFEERGLDLQGIEPTELFAVNRHVNRRNQEKLEALPGKEFYCTATDDVCSAKRLSTDERKALLRHPFFTQCRAEKELWLREGAQVVLVCNLNVDAGLCNGARGVIKSFELIDNAFYPKVRFLNGRVELIGPHQFREPIDENTTLSRHMIPLRLAWAMSIHGAQGATLDFAKTDLDRVFTAGQAYTALSRVRSTRGLQVSNFSRRVIHADPLVVQFYSESLNNIPLWCPEPPPPSQT